MTTLSPTLAPQNRVSHDQCCPADDGFCPNNDGHTFLIPLLDLSAGSAARPIIDGKIDQYGDDLGDNPVIDGWVGAEYLGFTELPMFNGGKNGADGSPLAYSGRIGTAYIAYDCSSEVVCASAHLDSEFLKKLVYKVFQNKTIHLHNWVNNEVQFQLIIVSPRVFSLHYKLYFLLYQASKL